MQSAPTLDGRLAECVRRHLLFSISRKNNAASPCASITSAARPCTCVRTYATHTAESSRTQRTQLTDVAYIAHGDNLLNNYVLLSSLNTHPFLRSVITRLSLNAAKEEGKLHTHPAAGSAGVRANSKVNSRHSSCTLAVVSYAGIRVAAAAAAYAT